MTEDLRDRLQSKSSQEQNQRTLYGAPKSECVRIWQLIFWRGGRIFEPTKHDLNPRKHDFKKREAQDSLSEKKNQDEIDFPPRFGELISLHNLGNVNT